MGIKNLNTEVLFHCFKCSNWVPVPVQIGIHIGENKCSSCCRNEFITISNNIEKLKSYKYCENYKEEK